MDPHFNQGAASFLDFLIGLAGKREHQIGVYALEASGDSPADSCPHPFSRIGPLQKL